VLSSSLSPIGGGAFEVDGTCQSLRPMTGMFQDTPAWSNQALDATSSTGTGPGIQLTTPFPASPSPLPTCPWSPECVEKHGRALLPGPLCEDDCTLHSEAFHYATKVVHAYHHVPSLFLDQANDLPVTWAEIQINPVGGHRPSPSSWDAALGGNPLQSDLPRTSSSELIEICKSLHFSPYCSRRPVVRL